MLYTAMIHKNMCSNFPKYCTDMYNYIAPIIICNILFLRTQTSCNIMLKLALLGMKHNL